MFNPFYPFTTELLTSMVKQGKRYFVRQTFKRGFDHFDEGIKGYFFFTHYDSLVTAQDHFGVISYDPHRFLYDWDDPEHRERLYKATTHKEYKVYAAVLKKDWEKGITNRVEEKVRAHVAMLGWNPKSGEMVNTSFELRFGELLIHIKYGVRKTKIKFEDIEKQY